MLLISHVTSLMPPCPSTHPCSSFRLRPWPLLSSFAFSPLLPTITRWWARAHLHRLLAKRICKITFSTGAILWGLSLIAFFPFPLHLLERFFLHSSSSTLFLSGLLLRCFPVCRRAPTGVSDCGRSVYATPCFEVTGRDRYAILKRGLMNFWHLIISFAVNISQLGRAGLLVQSSEVPAVGDCHLQCILL